MNDTPSSRVCVALLFSTLLVAACGREFDQDGWLKQARLGPHLDPGDTLQKLEGRARAEGSVVVWSMSSRMEETGRAFEKRYGIKCEVQAMSSQNLVKKVRYDQQAGGFNADVYLFGDAPEVLSTLVKSKAAWPWLSPELEAVIPAELRVGLPAHHVSAVGLIYNSELYAEPPVKSWWDLTTPEWQGRVVTKDLSKAGGSLHLFTTFVQHSDEMARDYRERFGEEIDLHGSPNAGYEFVRRFLANKPIFTASGSEAADKVGASNVTNPPVGIMTLGKVRYKGERSLNLKWVPDLKPAAGIAFSDPIAIANGAKHPDAAKLFVHFALDREGFTPYMEYGTWPARSDLPLAAEMRPLGEMGFWFVDPEFHFRERRALADFILEHQ